MKQETARNKGEAELSLIEDICRTSNWSDDKSSKLQSPERSCAKRDQSPRVKNGKKACEELKVRECFRWKTHGQCSKKETRVVSVMSNLHKEICAVSGLRQKGRLLLHPNRRQTRLTERDKKPQWDQAVKRKALLTRVKFHADSNSVRHASCKLWHHPVCSNYTSERGCVCGDKYRFRHVEEHV